MHYKPTRRVAAVPEPRRAAERPGLTCGHTAADHSDSAADVRKCKIRYTEALALIMGQLGAVVLDTDTPGAVEAAEAQTAREARQRAAGLTPRGRAPRPRPAPARPLVAPAPAPPPEHPRSRPVRSVTAGPSVDDYRAGAAS